jgi:hypothetical protein
MSSVAERSARAARQALDAAIRDSYDRMSYKIERFGRHRDGYLHALVRLDNSKQYYFHCRYGSWLAPGTWNGRSVLKEPEALLGSQLGASVKYALAEAAQKFHPTPQPEEESNDPRSGDEAVPAAGVPEAGDRDDASGGVQAVGD